MIKINTGKQLIFLISQPRSGSSLLQRILGNHSDVSTLPEPWIMLHPVYALRNQGIETEYNAVWANQALHQFLAAIHEGEQIYMRLMREMYDRLYRHALSSTHKRFFLDKTPRYYFIIPELKKMFPEARFIILLRNPIAVCASILNTWVGADWRRLVRYECDLKAAPSLLINGTSLLEDSVHTVRYEDLVRRPEETIKNLCAFLGIRYYPTLLQYDTKKGPDSGFGDPRTIHRHNRPVSDYSERWADMSTTRQSKALFLSYITFLGKKTMESLGYSYDENYERVKNIRTTDKRGFVIPWNLILPDSGKRSFQEEIQYRILSQIQRKGIAITVIWIIRRSFVFLMKCMKHSIKHGLHRIALSSIR